MSTLLKSYFLSSSSNFKGIVDILNRKAYIFDGSAEENYTETDVPEDLKDLIEEKRIELIEAVAEFDDELMEKYLEGEEVSVELIKKAMDYANEVVYEKNSNEICDIASLTKILTVITALDNISDINQKVTITSEEQIDYVTYRWDDGEEQKIKM